MRGELETYQAKRKFGDTPEPKDLVIKLYLPWQLIFAFFLAALLRPSPKRGEAAATTN